METMDFPYIHPRSTMTNVATYLNLQISDGEEINKLNLFSKKGRKKTPMLPLGPIVVHLHF